MKNLRQGMTFKGLEEYNGYGHNGAMGAFRSSSTYFPAENLSVSVTVNGNRYQVNDIAEYAIRCFL